MLTLPKMAAKASSMLNTTPAEMTMARCQPPPHPHLTPTHPRRHRRRSSSHSAQGTAGDAEWREMRAA